jgi:hypothetical protein
MKLQGKEGMGSGAMYLQQTCKSAKLQICSKLGFELAS